MWISPSLHQRTRLVPGVSPLGLTQGRVPAGSLRSSTWLWGRGMCSHVARSVGEGRQECVREGQLQRQPQSLPDLQHT